MADGTDTEQREPQQYIEQRSHPHNRPPEMEVLERLRDRFGIGL